MLIAIVYNDPGDSASDLDVLVQLDNVSRALSACGHHCISVACTLDLERLRQIIVGLGVDCVFNLVESLGGTDRLAGLVPQLLEATGIPYTGSAILQTTDKVMVKRILRRNGLPTPDWVTDDSADLAGGRFIIKPRYEHASVGIDDSAVVHVTDGQALLSKLRKRTKKTGLTLFAERFVEGREFNIAAIADETGKPHILNPAEIDFSEFPKAKPRIVGYSAKWIETSFEYRATPRIFRFPPEDQALLGRLRLLSETVWDLFQLRGYARVDFRVDADGNPFILEVNANPCLSPDAGFAAALAESNLTFEEAMSRIVSSAMLELCR